MSNIQNTAPPTRTVGSFKTVEKRAEEIRKESDSKIRELLKHIMNEEGIHDIIITEGQQPEYKQNGVLQKGFDLSEWTNREIFRLVQLSNDISASYYIIDKGTIEQTGKPADERIITRGNHAVKNKSGAVTNIDGFTYHDDVLEELLGEQKSHDFTTTVGKKVLRCHINKTNPNILTVFIRVAPKEVPKYRHLNLPNGLENAVIQKDRGLILISGIVSSGKTTTANSLIDTINTRDNRTRKVIITAEDPIEYVHNDVNAKILQRSVGINKDTPSFAQAAKDALREAANVIYIGELRSWNEMESALQLAETGHLVISTIHANSAVDTVERFVRAAPPEIQENVRSRFNENILGIAFQELVTIENKRYPLMEQFFIMNLEARSRMRDMKSRSDLEHEFHSENTAFDFRQTTPDALAHIQTVSDVQSSMEYDKILARYQETRGYNHPNH